ncbi:MAG: carbohydrate kinase family protein [Patescibacteria group bacterium]|nr:carbohydrate kinase family protein [Patescibacteria group bacterium]
MFDIITIGTATRDVFLKSSFFKVLRDPIHLKKIGFKTGEAECFALGTKLNIDEPVLALGGGAANTSITFSRQGFRTAALVRVGSDEFGETIIKELKNEKVTPIAVKDKKTGTAYSTILLTPGGERTVLVYRGASGDFQKKEVPIRSLKARWAYISPGTIAITVIQSIISHLKKKGTMVAMNPSKHYLKMGAQKLKPLLKSLDVVVINREEASYLTGLDYKRDKKIFKKFKDMVGGTAIMTDGARGSFVSDGEYFYRAGTFKEKKLIDRTGAGDAFGSAFVAGLIQKKDICWALRLASANATSVIEHIGAQEGILRKSDFKKKRWQYLDLDVDPV